MRGEMWNSTTVDSFRPEHGRMWGRLLSVFWISDFPRKAMSTSPSLLTTQNKIYNYTVSWILIFHADCLQNICDYL